MPYGYLYITTNLINNKRYVGQRRGDFCPTYFGSGHGIKNAIKYYGVRWFRVDFIKSFDSRCELDDAEIKLIKNYRLAYGYDNLYNQSRGGTGGDNLIYNKDRDKIYERISSKLKGRKTGYSYWTGKKHSAESNLRRSLKLKGKKFSEETNRKRAMAQIGNKYSCGKGKRQQGLLMAIYI